MGTRSLTIVEGEEGAEICVLYRQYDGYPTGHGAKLKSFLEGIRIVNGLSLGNDERVANGMDCLAAQIVAHFKKEPGGFYLHPAGTRDCGEEYIYTVYLKKGEGDQAGELYLKLQAGAVTFFGLPGTKQDNMPVIFDGSIKDFDPQAVEVWWHEREIDPPNDFLDDQVLSQQVIGRD